MSIVKASSIISISGLTAVAALCFSDHYQAPVKSVEPTAADHVAVVHFHGGMVNVGQLLETYVTFEYEVHANEWKDRESKTFSFNSFEKFERHLLDLDEALKDARLEIHDLLLKETLTDKQIKHLAKLENFVDYAGAGNIKASVTPTMVYQGERKIQRIGQHAIPVLLSDNQYTSPIVVIEEIKRQENITKKRVTSLMEHDVKFYLKNV